MYQLYQVKYLSTLWDCNFKSPSMLGWLHLIKYEIHDYVSSFFFICGFPQNCLADLLLERSNG